MEEKKQIKVSLGTVFIVIAIILIVVMGALFYMQKTDADKQIAELENNASKLQEKIDDLQGKIDNVSNIGNTDTSNNNTIKIEGEYHLVGNDNSEGVIYKFEGNTVKFITLYTTEGTFEVIENKIKITYIKAYELGEELDTLPNGQYDELTIVDENTLTSQRVRDGVVYKGKYVKKIANTTNETKTNFAVLELSPIGGTAVLYNGEVYVNVYDASPNIIEVYGEEKYKTFIKTRESYLKYDFGSLTINNNSTKWLKLDISNVKAIYNNDYGQAKSSVNPKYGIIMLNEDNTVSYISTSSLLEGKVETTKLNVNNITNIYSEDNMGFTTYLVDANGNKKDVNNYIK